MLQSVRRHSGKVYSYDAVDMAWTAMPRPGLYQKVVRADEAKGRYLGLIRQIPASRRGQYQRIAKEQSREAAIREMESVLKK